MVLATSRFIPSLPARYIACMTLALSVIVGLSPISCAKGSSSDLVIYGGTPAGVAAALQGARMGKSVTLIEPGGRLGGMTAGGLGWVDVGDPSTIGGIAREYFHRVWQHYQKDDSWKWEPRRSMPGQHGKLAEGDETMWIVEPGVAESLFEQLAADPHITIVRSERLNRTAGVHKGNQTISSITMESGRTFDGRMFIDASYEGDLLAAAGVSYIVGREPNSRYQETNNGVRSLLSPAKFPEGIDPYRIKGDPASGLLPRVEPDHGLPPGEGDRGVQAYNFRMCLTDVPENRVAIEKPADYDESQYELLLRALEIGTKRFITLDLLPNRKTDSNNLGYVSTDFIGMSAAYPEADYATREKIIKAHEQYQRGFMWTLQNHPRVPQEIRDFYAPWGLARDEFNRTGNWPHQLYIREARRMVADYVVTENTALGKDPVSDPVGLGSYAMDSHAIRHTISPKGFVKNEGGMFVQLPGPYGISYRAIIPKEEECRNLLVPVCASATHAAYGSMRMEPVFMVLGQSAATAACLAMDRGSSLQSLPYTELREKLLADHQILDWPSPMSATH
ncbi:FAD-dependent oxidoreductase [Terrimicrobium sacchariphilum]|nr:FAD-dependent oxidoreductase [Terrimicrobium sacchariphilum]